jgi:DNA-binding transcriptional LysR family regulator
MYSRDIEYILAIYEEGSITKAAEKLFLTQPALSRYIINLENRLDAHLFDRSTIPLSLTQYGRAYVKIATKIRNLCYELKNTLTDLKDMKTGSLKFGIPQLRGEYYLPILLPRFKAIYPDITLEIEVGSSLYLEECVLKGKVEFIILNGPLHINPDECHVDVLAREALSIATPPGMLTKKNNPYTFDYLQRHLDLDEQDYILLRPQQRMRQLADKIMEQNTITPQSLLIVGSLATAKNLVASGMGLTVVNEIVQRNAHGSITPDYYSLGDRYIMDVIIARRKNAYFSKAAQEFIKLLIEHYGTHQSDHEK